MPGDPFPPCADVSTAHSSVSCSTTATCPCPSSKFSWRSADAPGQQLRIKEIAQRIDWEKSRVSHQVTRLERRRLLVRSVCETDARGWWVSLTPAGAQAVSRAVGAHQNAVRRYFFDVLQEGEEMRINDLSTRVVDAIDGLRHSA